MSAWESEQPWQQLRTEFIEEIDRGSSWRVIWLRLVTSDTYQDRLRRCAKIALAETRAPSHWLDDVVHDALFLLARQLESQSDLGYQFNRPPEHFGHWLRTILFRQCHEAIRLLRRRNRVLPLQIDFADGTCEIREQKLDVRMAIKDLDEPFRRIMYMDQNHLTIGEIADRLGLSYWIVRRVRLDAIEMLRNRLHSGYCND